MIVEENGNLIDYHDEYYKDKTIPTIAEIMSRRKLKKNEARMEQIAEWADNYAVKGKWYRHREVCREMRKYCHNDVDYPVVFECYPGMTETSWKGLNHVIVTHYSPVPMTNLSWHLHNMCIDGKYRCFECRKAKDERTGVTVYEYKVI